MMNLQKLAKIVDKAALTATSIEQLSKQEQFNEEEAYEIQALSLDQRYERGEKLVGLKMGFTSKAKMEQMGVHDMIWGRLTNTMFIENGGTLEMDKCIHPRAEPEICFLVKETIDRPLDLTEAKKYISGVAAALEIIDSRYQNFKFSLEDVIADNCSATAFVVGEWQSVEQNIGDLKIELVIDGESIHAGSSKAILGNPWESIVAASRLAAQYQQIIPKGAYIMAGAATAAVYLKKGQSIKAEVENLGTVSFKAG